MRGKSAAIYPKRSTFCMVGTYVHTLFVDAMKCGTRFAKGGSHFHPVKRTNQSIDVCEICCCGQIAMAVE
jgi:hypothetical protein